MQTRLLTPFLAGLLLAPIACGDDKGGSTGSESDGSTSSSPTTGQTPTTSTTADPSGTTTDEPTPTTTTDPNPTTSTSDGSSTGDPVGCQAPADGADEDMDGVANMADNCRCDANPNQLDFDGNKIGNVCDQPLTFTLADGAPPEFNKLATTAKAGMSIVSCMFPVDLVVLNGEVQVSLDDTGTAKFYAKRLNFADTPELECDLTIVKVTLIIQDFFSDGPDPFVVGFPFTLPDHAAGAISGQTDSPHSILVSGVINVTSSTNEGLAMPGENPINMVPGAFPTGLASVINKGDQVSVVFDDNDSVIFMQTTDSGIEIELRGLKGTLRLTK